MAIFLLPVSPSLNLNNDGKLAIETKANIALAGDATITTITANGISDTSAKFKATLRNIDVRNSSLLVHIYNTAPVVNGNDISYPNTNTYEQSGVTIINAVSQVVDIIIPTETLTANTPYWLALSIINLGITSSFTAIQQFTTSTSATSNDGQLVGTPTYVNVTNVNPITGSPNVTITTSPPDLNLGCSIGIFGEMNLTGCVAEFVYLLWKISALIAHVAGLFLDFFVYYSTNSSSYTSGFISKGWGAIRDVANIFFIIALLYIAIKTILSLNVTNNKKIIGTIIIVALLINFSLFFTQVIIDGSNILAKVFYNNIVSKNPDGSIKDAGTDGQKSISIGLVDKFNPQGIVTQEVYDGFQGTFIFLTILLIAITLYMAYIFFSVALLFVGRVVALWISMIFAPIAFASYTLPFDIPGLGHKEWWSELLKNAFLAPLFIFMLYIIVMFAGFLKDIPYADGDTSTLAGLFQHVMSVTIPFILLFILLMKAKQMAIEYSGKIGEMMMKATKAIGGAALGAGGLALGAASGGAAVLARRTFGKSALGALEGEKGAQLRKQATEKGWSGFKARQQLKAMEGVSKASFDVRKTKAGGAFSKATGMNLESAAAVGLGYKEGGYAKTKEDVAVKRQKRAEKLKVGKNETESVALRKNQEDLNLLKTATTAEITKIDKQLIDARERLNDVSKMPDSTKKKNLQAVYTDKVNALVGQKTAVKNGKDYYGEYQEENGDITTIDEKYETDDKYKNKFNVNGKNLKQAEVAVIGSENKIATENATRLRNEAERLKAKGGEINLEAAHRINAGAAIEENKQK